MNPVVIVRGMSIKCYPVESGSIEAITHQRLARKPSEADDELWVNQGAGGLGDALLGLCAIRGLRKLHPRKTIVYRVKAQNIRFAALFNGGYDGLADYVWDETWNDFPENGDPRDLQLNQGYKREIQKKAEITRLQRYCRNLGNVIPELPPLRDPDFLKEAGKEYRGYVVLCPFTGLQSRDWPQFYWLALEEMLNKAGIRTIIVGALREKQRADQFRSALAIHTQENPITPELTASIIYNAGCVVGCDSGLAHLAGLMVKRTIVLCGWSTGDRIFDFYPRVECLQGTLPCTGCWTCASAGYDEDRCSIVCDNLATLTPERVFKQITTASRA